MLLSQDLRRRHQRRLIFIGDGDYHGLEGHDRLAASDITLQQANHRVRGFQVVDNLLQDAFLCPGRVERENHLDLLPDTFGGLEPNAFTRAAFNAAKSKNQLEQKKFFENQTPVVRRAALVQFRDVIICSREVNTFQAGPKFRETV